MRGSTAVNVNTCVIFFPSFFGSGLTCCAHVQMFCVNQLSGRERGGKKKGSFVFSPAGQQMSEFMFY